MGMPPPDDLSDWLGDLRWQGYPRLEPVRDAAAAVDAASEASGAHRPRKAGDARVEALARENEALRAKIETLVGLVSEFERRLSEAASSYEGAALENGSARRAAELECSRLAGELESARAEFDRTRAREAARESAFALERERRADCEKANLETRRRLNDLETELAKARGRASELEGAAAELRRFLAASQASGEKA